MKSGASMTVDRFAKVTKAIGNLVGRDVLVGIPSTQAARDPEPGEPRSPMNNATIGYIMENGSPKANIPARPWLVPGIQSQQDEISEELRGAADAALSGNMAHVNESLNRAGQVGEDAVRLYVNTADFQPLSDATLRARARRGTKGSKGAKLELLARSFGYEPEIDVARPLIDSGQFRNSIRHVVR